MRNINNNSRLSVIETLESRELMTASPLTISTTILTNGTQLNVTGTAGNDKIIVSLNAAGQTVVANNGIATTLTGTYQIIRIDAGAGDDSIVVSSAVKTNCVLIGNAGNDTLVGGSGNDMIYGNAGINTLTAGSGNATLVTIGSTADNIYGGAGKDSFWTDNNAAEKVFNVRSDETAAGAVHRINNFYGSTTPTAVTATAKSSKKAAPKSKKAKAAALAAAVTTSGNLVLAEPATTDSSITYASFSNHPLFAQNGPAASDIQQGYLGDCYFLSTLAAIAKTDPARLQQSILDLNDGTYVVQFQKAGQSVFVHVDNSLPVWNYNASAPAYAGLGQQGSMWAAIIEKAYTYFRSGAGTYNSIQAGWMDDAFSALGAHGSDTYAASSGTALLNVINNELKAGQAVTYATIATPGTDAPLVGGHAYTVDGIVTDATGNITGLRLRNPWGIDGAGHDSNPNDGYVTLTPAQALSNLLGVVSANV